MSGDWASHVWYSSLNYLSDFMVSVKALVYPFNGDEYASRKMRTMNFLQA
jgi:hypothetical protein